MYMYGPLHKYVYCVAEMENICSVYKCVMCRSFEIKERREKKEAPSYFSLQHSSRQEEEEDKA